MSASRMPGATWMPLPEAADDTRYTKTQLIFHSTGTRAGARANKRYFARPDVTVESTFIVDYDGEVLQVMEAGQRADANGKANKRAISVEVVGEAHEPFTDEQLASCVAIADWACSNHPITRRRIPSEPESGIGWHVMFGAPGPWTSVRGKECPGQKRIAQIVFVIIPAVRDVITPARPAPRGDLMFIINAKGDTKQYLIQNGGGTWIPDPETSRELQAKGVPWLQDRDPEFVTSLISGGAR